MCRGKPLLRGSSIGSWGRLMWAGAAMGFVATGPFIIHFWCRADLPLAHERHRGGVARRADRRDLSLAHGRTDFLGPLCGRGRSGSRSRHSTPSSYGVTVAACISMMQVNVRPVFVQADMPRNGGRYTIRRSTRRSVGMPRLGRTPRLSRGV